MNIGALEEQLDNWHQVLVASSAYDSRTDYMIKELQEDLGELEKLVKEQTR